MYANEVKELIGKRADVEFTVSTGTVSAIANIRPNDMDMELRLFDGRFVVEFDRAEVVEPHGIELIYEGVCVASIDVSEWERC